PGLQVYQSSGTVGGEVHLQVRAPSSLALSTEPIVIVDGIRFTSWEGQAAVPAGPFTTEPTSRLNDLNPNDIETIEVVKGPSAATLYGTDASNGVVVITTKRGRPGPARWNAYGRAVTTATPTPRIDDNYWGWQSFGGVPFTLSSCTLPQVAQGFCTQDSITVLPNPLRDPALTLFSSKPSWEYGANVSGGRQDLRYYFSGDFERAMGPVQLPPAIADSVAKARGLGEVPDDQLEPNALTRANLRANATAMLGEEAELRVAAGYSRKSTRTLSFVNPYRSVAGLSGPGAPYGSFFEPAGEFAHPSTEKVDRFTASASGQWRPVGWLMARATVGLDLANSARYTLARRGESPFAFTGSVGDDRARRMATTADLGLAATFGTGRVRARTAVGAQYVRNVTDGVASFGSDLPPGGASLGQAASTSSYQLYAETATLGSYLEQMLGWNERLFLTGAVRVDGASAFGRDYDAAVYPKASASWLLSAEPWMPNLPGVDELRLRYAFGTSGQQAIPSMTLPRYSARPTIIDGIPTVAVTLLGLGNADLRPERVREHELGLDASALRGRLRMELTWYRRRATDQIASLSLPPGFGVVYTNLGRTAGRGFEAQVAARVLDAKAVSWDVAVQHSSQTTTLVDLGGLAPRYSNEGGWVEGYPLGARFMRPLLGYTDANGDGIIEPGEVQLGDTAVYVGPSTPPRSQTLTSVVGLFRRRLRLSALLERRSGFVQLNGVRVNQCYTACRAVVDPTSPLADQAKAAALNAAPSPAQPGAQYTLLEPGDFTRLREVTAALDLPVGVARALRVSSATLSLSARNLALWSGFSGPDPESASVNGVNGGQALGIPQGRSWALRLDLGF
ncbi:MAG TPA: TonB-dependent receptor, partial [Gemmatimonadales bacterium]|nr:TonB-dependent receptor [Gemmatimonadales bacterium]